MSKDGGFIKLYREIIKWEWFKDPNTLTLFIYLLTKANHKEKKWKGITIKRGQLVTSYSTMAEETGLSVRNLRTALGHLKSTGEVTSEVTNRWQLISVENYSSYQDRTTKSDKQSDKQPTTNKNDKKNKNINSQSVLCNNYFATPLTADQTDRLFSHYHDPEGLMAKVEEKIATRKNQDPIKNPYRYISMAAKNMGWPTREEVEQKEAKRKKNQAALEEASKPKKLSAEEQTRVDEIKKQKGWGT